MATANTPRPDITGALAGLKDFQRASVDYVFRRMYTDSDYTRRFLIADEVGLGKTMVAKGVIARAIDHLWDRVERIDIVYICSNADIARQNIDKLAIGNREFVNASRITMLPLNIREMAKLNFISFTPQTSFELSSSMGRVEERVLLFRLLDEAWEIGRKKTSYSILCGDANRERFTKAVQRSKNDKNYIIDRKIGQAFRKKISAHRSDDGRLDQQFEELRDLFSRREPSTDARRKRSRFIGELREVLANTCLEALEPDLIILDEFQRFRKLLSPDDAAGQLAKDLFTWSNSTDEARVLLLSATPYKMYTLPQEQEGDDHYADFIRTMSFLQHDEAATTAFEARLKDYRHEVYRIADNGVDGLRPIKQDLEIAMRKVMARTERLAASVDRDAMVKEISPKLRVDPADVMAFVPLQNIARVIGAGDALEYWKAAPYLLNFMDAYALKDRFYDTLESGEGLGAVKDALGMHPELLLNWSNFEAYARIDPGNARLRTLIEDTVGRGMWQLLWIPSSMPYYTPEGPYAQPDLGSLTKRLVFSSWKVVPKAVAALVSYEAERLMIASMDGKARNTTADRERRKPLLRFAKQRGRFSGMPVLALSYPAVRLAKTCDPLVLSRDIVRANGRLPSRDELLGAVRSRIEAMLAELPDGGAEGAEDESWYWAAPVLLDLAERSTATEDWLLREELADEWMGVLPVEGENDEPVQPDDAREAEDDDDVDGSHWHQHVEQLRGLVGRRKKELGRRPADLAAVLSELAVAGPGVVMLRALQRVTGELPANDPDLRVCAAAAGRRFRDVFNSPEAMALIRGLSARDGDRELAYWRQTLRYSIDGNLQAVMDEYVHFCRDGLGLSGKHGVEAVRKLTKGIMRAMALRTANVGADDVRVDRDGEIVYGEEIRRMRTHFALRFGDESIDERQAGRKESVRSAFNSPFWPFVLATTSVGQEGLDFHTYCHAVVHWNLPSNPVDLEQREGRVHRFKGHAIRKNIAAVHGPSQLAAAAGPEDPWGAMFAAAQAERPAGTSDLVPFWIYPTEGGATVERHVPTYPMSRDADRAAALKRSLAVYRMVFGQSRQEDLLAYLMEQVPQEELEKVVEELRIDLGVAAR